MNGLSSSGCWNEYATDDDDDDDEDDACSIFDGPVTAAAGDAAVGRCRGCLANDTTFGGDDRRIINRRGAFIIAVLLYYCILNIQRQLQNLLFTMPESSSLPQNSDSKMADF